VRKDWRGNLGFLLALIIVGGPVMVGGLWLQGKIERLQCSASAFLAGTTQSGLLELSLVCMIVPLVFYAQRQAARHIYWLRTGDDEEDESLGKAMTYGLGWTRLQLLIAAFFALAGLAAAMSSYCVGDSGILYREWAHKPIRSFAWRDVVGVQTGCHSYVGYRGSRHSDIHYNLVMRDGTVVNIMDNPRQTEAVWNRITAQLDRIPFWFDSRGVESGCTLARTDLLLKRP